MQSSNAVNRQSIAGVHYASKTFVEGYSRFGGGDEAGKRILSGEVNVFRPRRKEIWEQHPKLLYQSAPRFE